MTEYLDKFAIFARMNYKEGGYSITEGIRPLLDVNLIHSTDTINNDDITLQLFLHKREKKTQETRTDHDFKIRMFKTGFQPPDTTNDLTIITINPAGNFTLW